MRQRALRSRLPFTFTSDKETDQALKPFDEAQNITSPGDVPDSTNVSDDPPPNFTCKEALNHPIDDDLSNEVMFEDNNTKIIAISIPSSFNFLYKPSSSKLFYNFGLSLSSEESKEEENTEVNKHCSPKVTLESD
ncbi:unnamed protein product [Lactuca saligna]|uniref:Uncharacterized protein n=1 Tax=Lactuca saligna TaxID=75948 RepID=A0AA35V696_LACSI|nr:unnamed protein product [Lactuca saligna]